MRRKSNALDSRTNRSKPDEASGSAGAGGMDRPSGRLSAIERSETVAG